MQPEPLSPSSLPLQNCSKSSHPSNNNKQTLQSIVNSISFEFKPDKRKKNSAEVLSPRQYNYNNQSQSISISSQSSIDRSQKSKLWTQAQDLLFRELYDKYGTDFNYFRGYFPRKSKNQIKNKYKQIVNLQKKKKKSINKQDNCTNKKQKNGTLNKEQLQNIEQEFDVKFQKNDINLGELLDFKMQSQSPQQ